MAKRTWTISTQKDEGFMLNVWDMGPRRYLWPLVTTFHALTLNALFYTEWSQWLMNWIEDDGVQVARIPLSWDDVNALSPGSFDWSSNAHS